MFPRALACLTLLLVPAAATAADAIQPGKLELYPTPAAVSVELPFRGDDNGNATASFVWKRQAEAKWRNGVDMTIDRKRGFVWASVWPLEPGET
jgi:hypothetical protein